MRLVVRENCTDCGECLKRCPNGLRSLSSLECLQCSPREAECLKACGRNAIEFREGAVVIDALKCNGCMECVSACRQNAVEVVDGKAAKCDLCARNNFLTSCRKECKKSAISIAKSPDEVKKAEEILGRRVL